MPKLNPGRLAVDFLVQQRLEATPRNYHLAYVFVTAQMLELTQAIESITDEGIRLRQEDADSLIEQFLGTASSTKAVGAGPTPALEAAIREQVRHFAQIAKETGQATTDFGRDLQDTLESVKEGDPAALTEVVLKMVQRTAQAEQQLAVVSAKVDELHEELQAARDDAAKDALTGLPNRRGIERKLKALKGHRAVALCDIDHFKSINDRFGHEVGDRVLTYVASRLQELCGAHFVGRWGGEEFIVIAEGVSAEEAASMIESARAEIARRPIRVRETDQPLGKVNLSAGVSDEITNELALKEADSLLYNAKAAGRGRVLTREMVKQAA